MPPPAFLQSTGWAGFYVVPAGHWPEVERWLADGTLYLQDPATLIAAELLDPQPAETVLDLCAAPAARACCWPICWRPGRARTPGRRPACPSEPDEGGPCRRGRIRPDPAASTGSREPRQRRARRRSPWSRPTCGNSPRLCSTARTLPGDIPPSCSTCPAPHRGDCVTRGRENAAARGRHRAACRAATRTAHRGGAAGGAGRPAGVQHVQS